MGFVWRPNSLMDAGIDGQIEIRDPQSGGMTNNIILVQSKAGKSYFQSETNQEFCYTCSEADLNYWLGGNVPVILIISKPDKKEAYWVDIIKYFSIPSARTTGTIVFNKHTDRFNVICREALSTLAANAELGLFLSPLPKNETIYSNLLEVKSYPRKLYIASTDYRKPRALHAALGEIMETYPGEWFLSEKNLFSIHNLRDYPWKEVCDAGTAEDFDMSEWALSDDPQRQREFVRLMNRCLRQQLRRKRVHFYEGKQCYYFAPIRPECNRHFKYGSVQKNVSRKVVNIVMKKNDPSQVYYYHHHAFKANILRFNNIWYIGINPTHHYTKDGKYLFKYYKDKLAIMKRLENNAAVLGEFIMWVKLIKSSAEINLFYQMKPSLIFGDIITYDADFGLEDDTWLPTDPKKKKLSSYNFNELLPLKI